MPRWQSTSPDTLEVMPFSQQFMDNPKADRVKRVASLRQASVRRRLGLFLVEGPQAVREAVAYMPERVHDVYIDTSHNPHDDIISSALEAANPIYLHHVSTKVMEAISPDAQSIAAVVSSEGLIHTLDDIDLNPLNTEFSEIGSTSSDNLEKNYQPQTELIVACWQARDPGNEGTLIRTADASGCRAIILVDDSAHPLNPKVVRSSAGSLFHIPVIQASTEEFFAWAEKHSLPIWAADIHGTQEHAPYDLVTVLADRNSELVKPAATPIMLFGNEARGLPTEIVERASRAVMIPLYGSAESLNLAMSGAVMMYSIAMAQHQG